MHLFIQHILSTFYIPRTADIAVNKVDEVLAIEKHSLEGEMDSKHSHNWPSGECDVEDTKREKRLGPFEVPGKAS